MDIQFAYYHFLIQFSVWMTWSNAGWRHPGLI